MKNHSKRTVFYSWQADIQSNLNRNVIEKAIETAIKRANDSIKDPTRLYHFDKDVLNIPGSADINDVLLKKIDACSVFVGDITPVAELPNGKITPNANALFETGYAAGKKGLNRVILVMNGHQYPIERMPFDLKTKTILKYELSQEDLQLEEKKKDVIRTLSNGIKTTLQLLADEVDPIHETQELTDVQEKIKRERDIVKLERFLRNLAIVPIQSLISDGIEQGTMHYDIFTVYYNLQAVYNYFGFKLYDKEAGQLIDEFMRCFDASLSFGENFYHHFQHIYKFHENSSHTLGDYIKTLGELSIALKSLVHYVHEKYVEIDAEQLDREAAAAFRKEIQERDAEEN